MSTPLIDQGQFWLVKVGLCLHTKFHWDQFMLLPLSGSNAKFDHIFNFNIPCRPSGAEMKLNACAQLQTFPLPTVSKLFLISNGLMAILR